MHSEIESTLNSELEALSKVYFHTGQCFAALKVVERGRLNKKAGYGKIFQINTAPNFQLVCPKFCLTPYSFVWVSLNL